MRIGIDVGGTNTDAVLMDGTQVVTSTKTPTTTDVSDGITHALETIIADSQINTDDISAVMIGTTHFTNAIIERKHLMSTACIRLGLPATASTPPMIDWAEDIRDAIGGHYYLAHGGHEFDGRKISEIDTEELGKIIEDIKAKGIRSIAISSVFSPVNAEFEKTVQTMVNQLMPDASVTLSSQIGRIGLLERENAAIMNACLTDLAARTIRGFKAALEKLKITAPFYISQNDGTLMSADIAQAYPVLTFASGPTNSMRGAAFLSGLQDAVVVDIGGTTTDIGVLQHGFPRTAGLVVEIGGVRTNFRMPDTYSIGLGGGSIVQTDPLQIGPQSVGYQLTEKARVFGGDTLTTTDIIVASGAESIGNSDYVLDIASDLIDYAKQYIMEKISLAIDRMKTSADPVPVIVVGGGSILVTGKIEGASDIIKPDHYAVANAIGAAIAQVGGEYDQIVSLAKTSRETAIEEAKQSAMQSAVTAGANPDTVNIVDIDEVPLAYLPGNATRIMVKAGGDLLVP